MPARWLLEVALALQLLVATARHLVDVLLELPPPSVRLGHLARLLLLLLLLLLLRRPLLLLLLLPLLLLLIIIIIIIILAGVTQRSALRLPRQLAAPLIVCCV